jgi:transposase
LRTRLGSPASSDRACVRGQMPKSLCISLRKGRERTIPSRRLSLLLWALCARVGTELEETWLRFVDGRPVSAITTRFLGWCCEKLQQRGKKALLLTWDNASWHKSHQVREWIIVHNRRVKASDRGVRIVRCLLPIKSPWLNAIEPQWIHSKRKVVEPERLLGAYELADRVCRVFGCAHEEHLSIPQEVD